MACQFVFTIAVAATIAAPTRADNGDQSSTFEDSSSLDVEDLFDQIVESALALAAVGTAAMALVELFKAVLPLRTWFHILCLRYWFGPANLTRGGFFRKLTAVGRWLGSCAPLARRYRLAFAQLMQLGAGKQQLTCAWLDQPTQTLFLQVRDIGEIALDFPGRYRRLNAFLGVPSGAATTSTGREIWSHLVAREIEAVRLRTQWLWTLLNRAAATAVSAALIWWASGSMETLIGGAIFAPFAKEFADRIAGARSSLR